MEQMHLEEMVKMERLLEASSEEVAHEHEQYATAEAERSIVVEALKQLKIQHCTLTEQHGDAVAKIEVLEKLIKELTAQHKAVESNLTQEIFEAQRMAKRVPELEEEVARLKQTIENSATLASALQTVNDLEKENNELMQKVLVNPMGGVHCTPMHSICALQHRIAAPSHEQLQVNQVVAAHEAMRATVVVLGGQVQGHADETRGAHHVAKQLRGQVEDQGREVKQVPILCSL